MRYALILGAMALLLLGCEQTSDVPASGSAKPGTSAAAATTPAAAAVKDEEIPTEEDFEDEVAKEVTADNLEAEIDKMDKEIGQ